MDQTTPGVVERISNAIDMLREFALQAPHHSELMAAWAPTFMAVQKLGFTVYRVGSHLVEAARSDDVELMPADLAADLRADLEVLAVNFPGVDRVIFGTQAIDDLIDAATSDDRVSSAWLAAGKALGNRFEAMVEKLVGLQLDPDSAVVGSEQLVGYLTGFERILDKILDRWLADATGTS